MTKLTHTGKTWRTPSLERTVVKLKLKIVRSDGKLIKTLPTFPQWPGSDDDEEEERTAFKEVVLNFSDIEKRWVGKIEFAANMKAFESLDWSRLMMQSKKREWAEAVNSSSTLSFSLCIFCPYPSCQTALNRNFINMKLSSNAISMLEA